MATPTALTVSLMVLIAATILAAQVISLSRPDRPVRPANIWTLTWSDEFNGANGSPVDSTKWGFDTGGNGWGNNELECYTNRTQNAQQMNGNLVITAIKESTANIAGCQSNSYTSARLLTSTTFTQKEGRFEARIKVPYGQGMWPAFWMLGDNINTVQWPNCGEIDIMENIGREPATVHGTIHGPGYSGANGIGAPFVLPTGQKFSDDFHIFAVEWEPNQLRFYMDNNLYQTLTPKSLPLNTTWVYDHPFFIIMNVAVGGGWPGNPDTSTTFPQTMTVDYVRVYQKSN